MIYRKKRDQKPHRDGRMRVQASLTPETYRKLVVLADEYKTTLTGVITIMIGNAYTHIVTPEVEARREVDAAAAEASHQRMMDALAQGKANHRT